MGLKILEEIADKAHDFLIDHYPSETFASNFTMLMRFADQILSLKWPDGSPMVVVTSQDQSITAETMQIIEGRPFLLVDAEEFKAGWVKKAEGG